jgi:hypothetical protein
LQKSVLSLINYYKILRIPDYSGPEEIRKAYLSMAKEFHPDVNSDSEAEEIFKWVNRANETLGDEQKKAVYDHRLKSGYFLQALQKFKNSKETRVERSKKIRADRAQRQRDYEIHSYKKSIKSFPVFARFGLFSLILIYGMFLWYTYWIVNYADFSVYMLMLGMVLTMVGIVTIINTTYKRLRIRQFVQGLKNQHERKATTLMLVMLVLVPIVIIQISNYRKQYHLKNYPEYALAKVVEGIVGASKVSYTYKIDDKLYEKHTSEIGKVYSFEDHYWLIVRYSRHDPILAEPVDYLRYADKLFE